MGDVVSVEVDGELGPPPLDGERRSPRWGTPAAIGLVLVLVALLTWSLLNGRGAAGSSASGATAHATSTVPTTSTAIPTTTTSPSASDPTVAAQAALDAWGRFAGSGDLTELEGHFASGGAQLARLESEVEGLVPGNAYTVLLSNSTVTRSTDAQVTVTGDVTWIRSPEPTQRYRWAIDLASGPSGWTLVTARTVPDGPEVPGEPDVPIGAAG